MAVWTLHVQHHLEYVNLRKLMALRNLWHTWRHPDEVGGPARSSVSGLWLEGTPDCAGHAVANSCRKTESISLPHGCEVKSIKLLALVISAGERPDPGVRCLRNFKLLCPCRGPQTAQILDAVNTLPIPTARTQQNFVISAVVSQQISIISEVHPKAMTIPGKTIKCPNRKRTLRHPHRWPTGKNQDVWRSGASWNEECDVRETADPGRALHHPEGTAKLWLLEDLLSALASRGGAPQEGPWECAQENVKLKPWKLSPKSTYAVTQIARRVARIWLSYEVTCWHVLSNSLACPRLVAGIPSWVTTGPTAWLREQGASAVQEAVFSMKPTAHGPDLLMSPCLLFHPPGWAGRAFPVSVWQAWGNILGGCT